MNVAVLVKQVPRVEEMELLPDGRLKRDGVELEMNAYCRRAVSKGVEITRERGGRCVVFTLGPPAAEDSLREAVAWGADEGVHVCDPAFAGSDTLATARALAAAVGLEGPFDLVLVGRNSIDADTGQVGPEVAELLDLPFVGGVKELVLTDAGGPDQRVVAEVRCELDDGWRRAEVALPAVLSTAERLTEPCKVAPDGRAAVDAERIRRLSAAQLGPGPWGAAASPTVVGSVRAMEVERHGVVLSGDPAAQVAEAVGLLRTWGALDAVHHRRRSDGAAAEDDGSAEPAVDSVDDVAPVRAATSAADHSTSPVVAVVVEPGRPRMTRELLGEAVHLAVRLGGQVVAFGPGLPEAAALASWGADRAIEVTGTAVEEDVAAALTAWVDMARPWAVLVPGTLWGREVAARSAARTGTGLTGDAVGFGVENGRLVAWKPAFGGSLVAAITCTSPVQMATVRPGVLPLRGPRRATAALPVVTVAGPTRGRVRVVDSGRDDDVEALLAARTIVGVGAGVAPEDYGALDELVKVLGAELGASRKVTDKGWLPRARQIGITGHSVAPALYVAIGVSGKFNHVVGARGAGTIVAVNNDPEARCFGCADVGIVGDWREVVPLLAAALA
jgi:electron transfer flavoprotein alpha subunit